MARASRGSKIPKIQVNRRKMLNEGIASTNPEGKDHRSLYQKRVIIRFLGSWSKKLNELEFYLIHHVKDLSLSIYILQSIINRAFLHQCSSALKKLSFSYSIG